MLMSADYSVVAKAKTNVSLLVLNYSDLEEAREYIEELEIAIFDAQDAVNTDGMPYVDFTKTAVTCSCGECPHSKECYKDDFDGSVKDKWIRAVKRFQILNRTNKQNTDQVPKFVALI